MYVNRVVVSVEWNKLSYKKFLLYFHSVYIKVTSISTVSAGSLRHNDILYRMFYTEAMCVLRRQKCV